MSGSCVRDSLISGLSRQRESGEFCDVLIITEDNSWLTVHSNVLSVSSIYFSDIARNYSSLLPHIPLLRVGEFITLSATIQPSGSFKKHDILVNRAQIADDPAAEETIQDLPLQITTLTPGDSHLELESVLVAAVQQPGVTTVTLLPDSSATTSLPTVLTQSDCHTLINSELANATEEISATVVADVTEHDTVSPPPGGSSPRCSVAPSGRRGYRQDEFRYVLQLGAVEAAQLQPGLVTGCAHALVDFAYGSGALLISDETYSVLHELSRLLQMEEAVAACEKHAVDRLVGEPDAEPPPSVERPVQLPTAAGASPDQLRVCSTCSFFCYGAARMLRHRRMHHVRSYICAQCGVTRQKASQLLRHLINANHQEAVCSLCFHECAPGERMMDHYLRHNDPRPFFCSVCFARFPSRTGLNLHMPTHSNVRPFVCRHCGRTFKWRHALQSHVRTHGDEKQLLCDMCGYSTRYTGQFKAHRARHAGLTLACPQPGCTVRADTAWLLKDHLVTHAADKQYQCEVCGKKFGHVRNMRRHALLHGQRRRLACPSCPYQTTRSDKLKQHVRTNHADQAVEPAAPPPPPTERRRRVRPPPTTPARRTRAAARPTQEGCLGSGKVRLRRLLPKPEPQTEADGAPHDENVLE